MKVLIVSSGNSGCITSFVNEQAQELRNQNIQILHFLIVGRGLLGYLRNRGKLAKTVSEFNPDIIHAHYGFSGLLANLQRKIPVITTYHGDDINSSKGYLLSKLSIILSKHNIFVSKKLALKARAKKKYSIISCGIDLDVFRVVDKELAKSKMHLPPNSKNILFSASFDDQNKNYQLAKSAIEKLMEDSLEVNIIELNGYSREEVNFLMNAVNCVLVTSLKEAGPLVIKEAMAVNKCAVSTDVGDVREIFGDLDGYFLSSYSPINVAEKIKSALFYGEEQCFTNGREQLIKLGLDSITIAKRIIEVYQIILKKN